MDGLVRIEKNFTDLSERLAKENLDNNHFYILKENVDFGIAHVGNFKEVLATSSFSDEITGLLPNALSWLDNYYWVNHIAALTEKSCQCIKEAFPQDVEEGVMDALRGISNLTLGVGYIINGFLTSTINKQYKPTFEGTLRDIQIEITSAIFTLSYARIETSLLKCFEVNGVEVSTQLTKLWDKWVEHDVDARENFSDFEKKLKKMVLKEKKPFLNQVESFLKHNFPDSEKPLEQWLFLAGVRNSLAHRAGLSLVNSEVEIWEREYQLKKGEPFRKYADQHLILTLGLINNYFEILSSTSLECKNEWEGLKDAYCDIVAFKPV